MRRVAVVVLAWALWWESGPPLDAPWGSGWPWPGWGAPRVDAGVMASFPTQAQCRSSLDAYLEFLRASNESYAGSRAFRREGDRAFLQPFDARWRWARPRAGGMIQRRVALECRETQ